METTNQKSLGQEVLAEESGAVWERPVLEVLGAGGTAGVKIPTVVESASKVGVS